MSEWLCFTDRLQFHRSHMNTHGFIPEIRESIDEGEIFFGVV